MSNRYPSLDQYVPHAPAHSTTASAAPAPSTEYGNYQASYSNYPSPNDYVSSPSNPPPLSSDPYGGGEQMKSNNSAPQLGLFQDMGFLQDAVYSQVGSRLFDGGRQYVDKNFGRFLTILPLKYYFNVNNSYVFKKICLLLFPFMHKNWTRMSKAHNDLEELVPPREDINAPDLYIPIMSFVTYILMVGFVHGTKSTFTPEVLGVTASTGVGVIVAEILLIKACLYLTNSRSIPFLDLLAYCGYLFVGLIANVLLEMVPLDRGAFYSIVQVYPWICMAFFIMKTLGPIIAIPDMSGATKTKSYYLIVLAALQVVIMYFLGP